MRGPPAPQLAWRAMTSARSPPVSWRSLKSRATIALRINLSAASRNSAIVSRGHSPIGFDQSRSGQASASLGRIAMTAPTSHGSWDEASRPNRALLVPALFHRLLGAGRDPAKSAPETIQPSSRSVSRPTGVPGGIAPSSLIALRASATAASGRLLRPGVILSAERKLARIRGHAHHWPTPAWDRTLRGRRRRRRAAAADDGSCSIGPRYPGLSGVMIASITLRSRYISLEPSSFVLPFSMPTLTWKRKSLEVLQRLRALRPRFRALIVGIDAVGAIEHRLQDRLALVDHLLVPIGLADEQQDSARTSFSRACRRAG